MLHSCCEEAGLWKKSSAWAGYQVELMFITPISHVPYLHNQKKHASVHQLEVPWTLMYSTKHLTLVLTSSNHMLMRMIIQAQWINLFSWHCKQLFFVLDSDRFCKLCFSFQNKINLLYLNGSRPLVEKYAQGSNLLCIMVFICGVRSPKCVFMLADKILLYA